MGEQEITKEALERIETLLFGSKEELDQLLESLGFTDDE